MSQQRNQNGLSLSPFITVVLGIAAFKIVADNLNSPNFTNMLVFTVLIILTSFFIMKCFGGEPSVNVILVQIIASFLLFYWLYSVVLVPISLASIFILSLVFGFIIGLMLGILKTRRIKSIKIEAKIERTREKRLSNIQRSGIAFGVIAVLMFSFFFFMSSEVTPEEEEEEEEEEEDHHHPPVTPPTEYISSSFQVPFDDPDLFLYDDEGVTFGGSVNLRGSYVNYRRANSGNPVMLLGEAGSFDQTHVLAGSVISINDTYYHFYTGSYTTNKIGLAKSTDLINWNRANGIYSVISTNATGWDSYQVSSPSVFYENDTFYCVFVGYNLTATKYALMLANSSNGISWTRMNNGLPVFYGSGKAWDEKGPLSTSLTKINGTYHLFYGSSNLGSGFYYIGHAISQNLTNWTMQNSGDPITSYNTYTPSLVALNNSYYLLYATGSPKAIYAKHSTDLQIWTDLNGGSPVFNVGSAGKFDANAIQDPEIVTHLGKNYLLYSGSDGTNNRIGLASVDFVKTSPSVTMNYSLYDSKLIKCTGFNTTSTESTNANLTFILSADNGYTWFYWSGTSWDASDLSYQKSSLVSTINSHISSFPMTVKSIRVRTLLNSDGIDSPILESITISYQKSV